MNSEITYCILIICVLGWIPILALCKGISWIVDACHPNYIDAEDDDKN